jgi:hypothetical protein
MDTIASLAAQYGMQPHELAAFADLGQTPQQDVALDDDVVLMIHEALACAPAPQHIDAVTENADTDAVLDALAEVVDGAGYDDLRTY